MYLAIIYNSCGLLTEKQRGKERGKKLIAYNDKMLIRQLTVAVFTNVI